MKSLRSGRLIAIVCGSILALSALAAKGVNQFSAMKYEAAYHDYRVGVQANGSAAQTRLNDTFKLLYQNIRTISLLPTLKNIDGQNNKLSDSDQETIRRIYENANSNVQVSEIYVVPAAFNPQSIDPETGKPQVPLAMFDSAIADDPGQTASAADNKAPPVEDEEYKLLTEQIAFLKQQYPDNKKIDGLHVPLVSGHEVMTCDNSEFDATHNDSDRKGIVLSVPFYAQDGKLSGVVAAIIRTNVLRDFLPASNAALISPAYGYTVFSKVPGQAELSSAAVTAANADTKIKTSETFKIETADANAGWTLWTGAPDAEFENLPAVANIRHTERMGYGIVAAAALLSMLGFLYVLKRFYEPTQQLTNAMLRLSAGDLSVDVPQYARTDIIGQISKAVSSFGDNLRALKSVEMTREHVISELGRGLSRIQSGDLSASIDTPFPKEMDGLRAAFNDAVERLQSAISSVKSGADNIKNGSEQIATAADALARRTESQAANIEETAAAVSEITSTIKDAAAGARQAKDAVALAKEDAAYCEGIVNETIGAMKGIDNSSREITQIIGLMDEVAFQTNLLALNAGVEAARAGDVGRGFAVVASEVRALAQRSAGAAKQIKDLIATSRGHVELGVKLVGQTGTSLGRIVERVMEIDKVIGKIAESSQQQASALQEINSAVNQMDQMTQQNAAMAEQSNTDTRKLLQKSDDLNVTVGGFITRDSLAA